MMMSLNIALGTAEIISVVAALALIVVAWGFFSRFKF